MNFKRLFKIIPWFILFYSNLSLGNSWPDSEWERVSWPIKSIYLKDAMGKSDQYKKAYISGAVVLDGLRCGSSNLTGIHTIPEVFWPNEMLLRFVRGGTLNEQYYAAYLALDSDNIGSGIRLSEDKEFLENRKLVIRLAMDNIILGGVKYDNVCGKGRSALIKKLIDTVIYSNYANTFGHEAFLGKKSEEIKRVYSESSRVSGYPFEEINKWPRIYDR